MNLKLTIVLAAFIGLLSLMTYGQNNTKMESKKAELCFGDGMTIDSEGKLWVGLWNGNAVARFDPLTGELMEKIEEPAHNVTSCSFGGTNFDTLYVTSSSLDMTEEEKALYPIVGSLFTVKPGVIGVVGNFFTK